VRYSDSDVVREMADFEDTLFEAGMDYDLCDMHYAREAHLKWKFPGVGRAQLSRCQKILDWDPVREARDDEHCEDLEEAMRSVGSDDVVEFLDGGYEADKAAREKYLAKWHPARRPRGH
jgi:hypothetical protein